MDTNSTELNANASNDTFVGPVFPAYIRPAATVLCSLVMGIGILGNVMVLLVIFKSKDMRSSTNIFLMNLSVADLMVLLVCTPTALVEVHSKPDTWVLGEEMCKAVPFIETTVSHASVLTILAISFERYYAICEPLKAGYVCTKARACIICVCGWAIAALLTSPLLVIPEYGPKEYYDGTTVMTCLLLVNNVWSQLFFYLSISLFFWVPFLVLVVLYSVIALRLMSDTGVKGNETFSYRGRRQLVVMLGTVVILFFLCLMPFRVFILWHIAVPGTAIRSLGVERYFNLLYLCRILFYANSAVNPILYNLMSSKFRQGFYRLCSVHSDEYFMSRRRWELSSMRTATSSLSYSNSRRDWELDNRSKRIARNLPFTRRLNELGPTLQRTYVSQPDVNGRGPRVSLYKESGDDVTSLASEYDNVPHVARSKSETEFSALASVEDNGGLIAKVQDADVFPVDTCPFKYKESIRRSLMKSKLHKKMKHKSDVAENGFPIITFTQLVYDEGDPICLTRADTVWSSVFFLGTTFVFFALPLVILVVLYSIIANSLMASPSIVAVSRQDSTASTLRYRKQVVLMIFTVVVFFFTCMLPFRALVVYVVVVPHEEVGEALGNEGYFPLLYFCRVMFYVNSAVNPILYNLMSSKFRSCFLKLCGLKSSCLRKHTRALLRTSTFNTSTLTALTNSSIHRSSLFESLNRSKPSSLKHNGSKTSHRSTNSAKIFSSKDILPKCHFSIKPLISIRRRSSFNGIRNNSRLSALQRSHSSDSYFRSDKNWSVKSSIKFVHRNDSAVSKPLVHSGLFQCHSILKKHSTRSTSIIVRKKSDEEEVFYNYQLIPSCLYALNRSDIKESFV